MIKHTIVIIVVFFTISCQDKAEYVQGDWITGTEQEKIEKTERHFRGFDMAMVETGYRYQELYWAGMDANWPYAEYQINKLELAISQGLERRPARAKSAKHFMEQAIPEMKSAISKKDTAVFQRGFQNLTIQCNACHAMEKVPHFNVIIPKINLSPISLENY
ncbi:MAG: hypothetical protein WDZ45_02860 [Flavobacteriaceae bacterium]